MSSDSEMEDNSNNSVKNKNKKAKSSTLRRGRCSVKTTLRDTMKRRFKSRRKLVKVRSAENTSLDFPVHLQDFLEKMYMIFFLEPAFDEEDPELERFEIAFSCEPEKLWQGLPNLGNTCYMNAILQSLFSIPSFTDDLLGQGLPRSHIPFDTLSMCLVQLLILKSIYDIRIKEKLLMIIKDTISAIVEVYSGNIQNDAHEFLGHFLDLMKDMGKLNTDQEFESGSENKTECTQDFIGKAAPSVPICPVITNFEFELQRSITCKSCSQVVLKKELSNYLSVNLPQGPKAHPLSIQSTFELFFEAEELEYKCEKCKYTHSSGVHKFSRLPRVLIIHLKRYVFGEFWSLMKDGQEVVISKYIDLSPHCNESTKPPPPLSKSAHIQDSQIFKFFKEMNSQAIQSGKPSRKSNSKAKYSQASSSASSEKEPIPQRSQILTRRSFRELQQKDLEKCSRLNTVDSVNTIGRKDTKEELSEVTSGDTFRLIPEDEERFTRTTGPYFTDFCFQEMEEKSKPKKYNDTNMLVEFDFTCPESTDDFYEAKIQTVTQDEKQLQRMRVYEQALRTTFFQSLPDSGSLWYTEDLKKSTKLTLQESDISEISALDFDKSTENKYLSGMEKAEAEEAKLDDMGNHAYRLIGVVSHLGSTPHSGHYIADAYDFERQSWFTYNDLQVSSIQEAPMQEARLSTGYIFFYMHNEIFEELLERIQSS
ncbi:ubiquitin carboxyl-terminal hydrolase 26 [Erinaceus europaeus]|uniref:Ubiquitin carboxyl-terminal hydrolase n=1 Tax=Erinaceus europaeus TaxID=9365 RepID=A0A1S2ZC52_ERIEU|nr:ubiquitin carboxyl-terminal hydrolase 26 [Erinaceus europaeus]